MEKIIFPIGDWSFDGHAFLANFIVGSTFNLEKVRDIHFLENDFLGSLCSEFNQDELDLKVIYKFIQKYSDNADYDFIRILKALNDEVQYKDYLCQDVPDQQDDAFIEKIAVFTKENINNEDPDYLLDMTISSGKAMLIVWLEFLMLIEKKQPNHNPDMPLSFEIMSEPLSYYDKTPDDLPSIHFYGVNAHNKQLKTPGYGVWTCDEMDFFYPVN